MIPATSIFSPSFGQSPSSWWGNPSSSPSLLASKVGRTLAAGVAVTKSSGTDTVGTASATVARTATSEGFGPSTEVTPGTATSSPAIGTESCYCSSASNTTSISANGGTLGCSDTKLAEAITGAIALPRSLPDTPTSRVSLLRHHHGSSLGSHLRRLRCRHDDIPHRATERHRAWKRPGKAESSASKYPTDRTSREKSNLTSPQGPKISSVSMTVPRMKTVCRTPWLDGHSEEKSPARPRLRVAEIARSTPPQPMTLAWEDGAPGAPAMTTESRERPSRGSSPLRMGRRDRALPRCQPA